MNHEHLQKPLEHFRARAKRHKTHPLELAVLWVVGAHLVFLPWALGTMRLWTQWISLGFSVVGFGLALLPRDYTEEQTGGPAFRLHPWPKLIRFSIFWLGLALLALVVTQALNPAWVYQTDGIGWWMAQIPHKPWLPRGVSAPFENWNQWRSLIVYGSAWLTVCTLWIAFTRRRTLQRLLIAVALNGAALAAFGIAQRLLGNGKIFWFVTSPNASFFSSFIYKNHGAAYLDLALAVTCGLAGWYYLRGLRRLEKSNPSVVLTFLAAVIAISVLISYARGATVVMLVLVTACILGAGIHHLCLPREARRPLVMVILLLLFGFFLKTGWDALNSRTAWDRLRQGIFRDDRSLEYRERATAVALEMLGENWKPGVGAGSFRFTFPIYQHRHPDLTVTPEGRAMFWEHAHNDIVQIPTELGALGVGLVVLSFGFWVLSLVRFNFWGNPLSACLVFGLFLLLFYSWWDFPFQCPAILTTWCSLWAVAVMWARFEETGARGEGEGLRAKS